MHTIQVSVAKKDCYYPPAVRVVVGSKTLYLTPGEAWDLARELRRAAGNTF